MPLFDHFEFIAPFYEKFIKPKDLSEFVRIIGLPTSGRLLDAGGGTGRIAGGLRGLIDQIVVIDGSFGMLQQAVSKEGLLVACSHTESIPFPDAAFDRIIMIDALHHIYNREKTAYELWRVLKPGGKIVIEEPNILKPVVWVVAILEKLALMRSHFISPNKIAGLFNHNGAKSFIMQDNVTAWVVIEKLIQK